MESKKITVTGASGFIGSRFIALNNSDNVSAISLRKASMDDIDLQGQDVVLHCLGLAHLTAPVDDQEYFKVNKDICLELAAKAKASGVQQFIYISSTLVYGDGANDEVYTENSASNPIGAAAKSKLEAETGLLALADANFIVTIIRPPLVYGPGVKGNLLSFIKLAEKPFPLPFKGVDNNRAMVHLDNLIGLITKTVELKRGGVFTLADKEQISTERLIKEIRKHFYKRSMLFRIPRFMLVIFGKLRPALYKKLFGSFTIDCTQTETVLNIQQTARFDQGVKAMVEHYKKA